MKLRKRLALFGALLIVLTCLIIYRMADRTLYQQENSTRQFLSNPKINIQGLRGFPKPSNTSHSSEQVFLSIKKCKRPTNSITTNIHMSEVYDHLPFDNIDGGVWKQGWNIVTNPNKWNSNYKLKVFIVPHSHNDPGWLKTFEDYYTSETRHILGNMLKQLTKDPKKKFIWAEISFFSLWWDELSDANQEKVRNLIKNGQLEIVTGGWVMNDEANAHYYSMITQLTEGHQWMKTNIKVQPMNGWTIDPFGESPVMPYLLKKMGLENLVIQRVHYSVKKYFAREKTLEFRWRQSWDEEGSTDLLTHMTPFYSYDVPHSCGPNPKICCQFDFKRLPGNGISCPWKEPPKLITKSNVASRAQLLLDQYRLKSELYRSNVILVPLGDDFRYQSLSEWDGQFENYYKIINYINNNPQLNAEIKFGTLANFFNALKESSPADSFPTLQGDFFTYADRDDHYWSGYYTSRPFYKKMDRILIGYHRSAEILFSLGWGSKNHSNRKWLLESQTGFAKLLRDARRSLGLFQHHDGITGTARDNVMEDYARKMMEAINVSQHIIQQITFFLLSHSSSEQNPEKVFFDFDDVHKRLNSQSEKKVIILGEGELKKLVFFNSLTHRRKELASFIVFTPYVEVEDSSGNVVPCQISPVFSFGPNMDDSQFEISFVADVPALGLTTYIVKLKDVTETSKNTFSKVKILRPRTVVKSSRGFENLKTFKEGEEFSLENQFVALTINKDGLLKSITHKETMEFMPVHLDFISYVARRGKERSGAYLFLPAHEGKIVEPQDPLVRVVEGPLFSRVQTRLPNVLHTLTLYNTQDLKHLGIDIINVVDITNESNYELAMRISSHVKSGRTFHTDLNGFQMIERKRYDKLPIQGNFYPVPTASYIEDEKIRITILSAQPLGGASLKEGQLEVLQDRRLDQDDNRGLGQGVLDNRITPNAFRILLERRLENCEIIPSLLSSNAYLSSQSLLNPLVKMFLKRDIGNSLNNFYSPVEKDLPMDIHLLTVRTFDDEEVEPSAGFVFHRTHLDNCFVGNPVEQTEGIINLKSFLPEHFGDEVKKTSLSFLKEEEKISRDKDQPLCHMDFLSVILS